MTNQDNVDDALVYWLIEDYNQGWETSCRTSYIQAAFSIENGKNPTDYLSGKRAQAAIARLLKTSRIWRDSTRLDSLYYQIEGHKNTHLVDLAFRKNPRIKPKPEPAFEAKG